MRLIVPDDSFDVRIDFSEKEVSLSRLFHVGSAVVDASLLVLSSVSLPDPGVLFPLYSPLSTRSPPFSTTLTPLSFGLYTRVFVIAMCASSLLNETISSLLWKQTSHLLRYGLAPQRWASLFAADILSVLSLSHPVGSRLFELVLLSVGLIFASDCLLVLQDLLVRPSSSSAWRGPLLMRVSLPLLYLACQMVVWSSFFLLLLQRGGELPPSSSPWIVPLCFLVATRLGISASTFVSALLPPSSWIKIDPLIVCLSSAGRASVVATFLSTGY